MTKLTVLLLAILVLLPLATSNSAADEALASLSGLLRRAKRCVPQNSCTSNADCCGSYTCSCVSQPSCKGMNPRRRCM
uniref:Teretoxin Tsu15.4 n=1 Tax=Terebra subulata TaxID=89435 RepID=TF4_TERSU|nr:RecName: Full=Teretoxin Tsu15.4; Flags: Precursor [Terebra subulata]